VGCLPGIQPLGIADRTRESDGKIATERALYPLSEVMPADLFGQTGRAHLGVENNPHWLLDVSFNEDKSRDRKDHAAENFATLRRIALALLKVLLPRSALRLADCVRARITTFFLRWRSVQPGKGRSSSI